MASNRAERFRIAAAKRRLKAAQSLPDDLLPLAGHLFMSSTTEALALFRDANQLLRDRKLAALVLEAVQSGDWPMFDELLNRLLPDRTWS
jgi:hypothetical protein